MQFRANLLLLKKEQKVCRQSVTKKQDVLPTGFGKSLIFRLVPWVRKRNVELRTFFGCNCHAARVILEGQGREAV